MIRINLLPEEYRKKSRSSLKLMGAVSAAVTINGLLLAWYGWLAFGVSAEIESERAVLQTEIDGLTPQVAYHRALDAEQKSYAEREATLTNITNSRISWTRKIDELITVINSGGEGQRHFVWLDDLNVTQLETPAKNTAGSLRAGGHSGSDNFAQVANFLDDIEGSSFIDDFLRPAPPEGTQTQVDKELMPSVVWTFPLQLDLKQPEERLKNKAKSAPAGAAGPAAAANKPEEGQ